MFSISSSTLILGLLLLLLAVITPLFNPFFRKISKNVSASVADGSVPVTILLPPFKQSAELERNLPLFLSQHYDSDFEVVVVIEKTDIDAENVLKRYADNPHLYYTFIPESSRYMSQKKLAITLGVKAAKHEWVLLTEADTYPASEHWLSAMSTRCSGTADMVAGYTKYASETPAFRRFCHAQTASYLFRQMQHGRAYTTNCSNLLFRKSLFLRHDGFRGNLKFLRGEYDFLVNKYGVSGRLDTVLQPEAWLLQEIPSGKTWRNRMLYFQETYRHLSCPLKFRLLSWLDQVVLHLNFLFQLVVIVYSSLISQWILLVFSVSMMLLSFCLRAMISRRALAFFDEPIPSWKVPFFELFRFWNNLLYRFYYIRADKYDFISHKL